MDRLTAQQRSVNMSRIASRDTKPELAVRSCLQRLGFRFRLHRRGLPGTPDIVLPRHRIVVFVHGCFWHRHRECRFAYTPKSRVDFWNAKFQENINRDLRCRRALRRLGWTVLVIWGCQTVAPDALERRLRRMMAPHLSKGALNRTGEVSDQTGLVRFTPPVPTGLTGASSAHFRWAACPSQARCPCNVARRRPILGARLRASPRSHRGPAIPRQDQCRATCPFQAAASSQAPGLAKPCLIPPDQRPVDDLAVQAVRSVHSPFVSWPDGEGPKTRSISPMGKRPARWKPQICASDKVLGGLPEESP